jgi:MerR family transcriptional regulator, light-induced transcriptional regulator
MNTSISPDRPIYPMRVVLRRTGLSPDLLRAWERRYGVVSPGRTGGGQRLYSESDVERLTLLRRATLYGHAISQVAALDNEALAALVAEPPASSPMEAAPPAEADDAAATVARALEAVKWMDGATLDATLRQSALALGPLRFAEAVVAPLVAEIGERWHQGELRIVQEHLATSVIRQVVSSLAAFGRPAADARVLLTATTTGQRHEVGAMLAAAVAAAQGWTPVYLGSELSGDEIAMAAERTGADAIALGLTLPGDPGDVERDLTALVQALGGGTPVWVGGGAAEGYAPLLDRLGIDRVRSMTDLARRLRPSTAAA